MGWQWSSKLDRSGTTSRKDFTLKPHENRDPSRMMVPPISLQHTIGGTVRDWYALGPRNVLWLKKMVAEFVGTLIFVFFGTSGVHVSSLTNAYAGGGWAVAANFGFGLTFGIILAGTISGGHLNPAVSIAMAVFRSDIFPVKYLVPYILAQFLGAFAGAGLTYSVFHDLIQQWMIVHNASKKSLHGVEIAAAYGGYFPFPGAFGTVNEVYQQDWISKGQALYVEAIGTFFLMFMILAITDTRNKMVEMFRPWLIGFTLATLIAIFGPVTTGCFNPARDFGPRLVALCAGWGHTAIPGPKGAFWIYIVGPIVGALVAAFAFAIFIEPTFAPPTEAEQELEAQGVLGAEGPDEAARVERMRIAAGGAPIDPRFQATEFTEAFKTHNAQDACNANAAPVDAQVHAQPVAKKDAEEV